MDTYKLVLCVLDLRNYFLMAGSPKGELGKLISGTAVQVRKSGEL